MLPFQQRFLRSAMAPGIDTAALSMARGNGKSWLAAAVLSRVMKTAPHTRAMAGTESVLCAASIEQARIVFRFVREALEPLGGYRFQDGGNRIGITHEKSHTRLRVISSSGKQAMGLVRCPVVVADEPGSWETVGGELMYDAIQTAQGKPFSPLRAIYIGTLAPARRGWWHDLAKGGSRGTTFVTHLQGNPEKWDYWPEIRRCNPLCMVDPAFRKKLLEERDAARQDSRLKARFLSFRLNVPTSDESTVLLTAEDFGLIRRREVPPAEGQPIVGLDLGAGRSWSAAVAIWPNGRCEAIAVAPGIPGLDEQEKRDRAPKGSYARLVDKGVLRRAENLRVPPVGILMEWIRGAWGIPHVILCDYFRINELRDSGAPCQIVPRRQRWSEAGFDIRALQKQARDGNLAMDEDSEAMILDAVIAALVSADDQGNVRLIKRDGSNNTGRDDVAAALILAAGGYARRPAMATGPRFRVVRRA